MSDSNSENVTTVVNPGMSLQTREAAIHEAGRMLAEAGCVPPTYTDSMLKREMRTTTYLGSGVAIPHGATEDKGLVQHDGLAILQIPDGVEWTPGNSARLVVGIAAASDRHIDILRNLTNIMQNKALLEELCSTPDAARIQEIIQRTPSPTAGLAVPEDLETKREWVMDYPSGLHARPAALWVEAAKASNVPLRIRNGKAVADPRSMVSLLQLGAREGDTLVLSSSGAEGPAVLEKFCSTIAGLSAEEKRMAKRAAAKNGKTPSATPAWLPKGADSGLSGVPASPGLAIGTVHMLKPLKLRVPDKPAGLEEGAAQLEKALEQTRHQLRASADDAARRLGPDEAAIFKAQSALLDDVDLIRKAAKLMLAGHGPAWAWDHAVDAVANDLAALDNPMLAARAADLRDVSRRVLLALEPDLLQETKAEFGASDKIVLLAKDIAPSETAMLDPARVAALVTAQGGPSSHTAILARTLGISAVVAAGDDIFEAGEGTTVVVDGDSGQMWFAPSPEIMEAAQKRMEELNARQAAAAEEKGLPAQTPDGHRIEVAANINRPDQVAMALGEGAEGVGLMRTEFLFLELPETPGEEQQYQTYVQMTEALGPRPLIIRTLDIGGDKQVPHLDLPQEENPFLGVRGSRLLLRRPDLFEPQMRAIYRAALRCPEGGRISVMFSMISSVHEVLRLKSLCAKIRDEVEGPDLPLGIMVEVPAAAVMADALAKHVDFFSIGTNDLTQYTLAMDRQNEDLAAEADSLHPAVLRLIARTVQGAARHQRWVGVCGGTAGDPLGAAILTGLGVNELSMTPRDIPAIKSLLRKNEFKKLQEIAHRALEMEDPAEVRDLAAELEGTA